MSWGGVIPYIKYSFDIEVEYLQLVGIIFGLGLKLYFTNLVTMYRLYDITNRTTWLDPTLNVILFLIAYYIFEFSALTALFLSLMVSSLIIALYMYIKRRKEIRYPNYSHAVENVNIVTLIADVAMGVVRAKSMKEGKKCCLDRSSTSHVWVS